jgi:hypothetical protein
MGGATQGFARLTGITIWNDFVKGTISTLAQNRILGNIKNWNNLSKRELTWMGHVGIDEVTAKKIAKQMDLHGEKSNTIWVANTEKWGSERAPVEPRVEHIEAQEIAPAASYRKPANPENKMEKRPIIQMLKRAGGVEPDSQLAGELRHMGVTHKTAPGLYKKGGRTAVDNFVADESDLFPDLHGGDEIYIPPEDIFEAIRSEMAGAPLRTLDEQALIDDYDVLLRNAEFEAEELAAAKELAAVKEFDDAPNYEAAQAVRAFHAAIAKTADMQIVTKGVSDVPLWMHSNTGRLIMQFKSFAMASHQRVLLSGLQQGPRHIAQLVVTGTIMGMLVSYLKMIERGDIDGANALLENPGRAVAEGLDRSGILSWIMDVSSMAEKFNVPGVISTASRFAGDEDQRGPGSRYATRSKTGALAGPVSGFIEDFSKGMEQLVTGDYTKGGVNSMSRLLPGRSLPGVRSLLEYQVKPWAEDELVDE